MRPSVPASGDGHTFESNQSDDEKMAIVPGFDGSLYWISDEEPATNSGESEGSAAYLLPLNALEVADAPRTLCDEEGEDDGAGSGGGSGGGGRCGLIVGERATTLFALDVASGDVRWIREAHTGTTHVRSSGDDEGAGDKPLRAPKETTSPLEDYLWRGDDPVLKDMPWYVYSAWVRRIEKPEKKFKKDAEPAVVDLSA